MGITKRELLRRCRYIPTIDLEHASKLVGESTSPEAAIGALLNAEIVTDFQMTMILNQLHGDLCIDRYLILERIRSGRMGDVFLVWDTKLQRIEVLKSLPKTLHSELSELERFRREIALGARISPHPNVIPILDCGEVDHALYFTMPFFRGWDLNRIIRFHLLAPVKTLSVYEAVQFAYHGSEGLAHLHAHRIVHRDVKPSNLMFYRGVVMIFDLGVGSLYYSPVSSSAKTIPVLTQGRILGTPRFMAPEQIEDSTGVDQRADIYSLGATSFALLTGKDPYAHASSVTEIFECILHGPPLPFVTECPHAPIDLIRLLDAMVSRNPDDRPQSMQEVAESLHAILRSLSTPPYTSVA